MVQEIMEGNNQKTLFTYRVVKPKGKPTKKKWEIEDKRYKRGYWANIFEDKVF